MRFLPREEKFFALFLDQVRYIGEAAALLLQGAEAGNARLKAQPSRSRPGAESR